MFDQPKLIGDSCTDHLAGCCSVVELKFGLSELGFLTASVVPFVMIANIAVADEATGAGRKKHMPPV